ncbi:Fggy [Symbiodinium natans]|uniref:Fggy protein n=1 Tax=Symbiodinium natans TaxID=878477 RepID=A0A812UMJ5_9DINO|nr:Fggy [Symbiodinium natans]
MHTQARKCFVGVDVGTGSARAGVFDVEGRLLGMATSGISTRQPAPGHFEQSSDEIWRACCISVREALSKAGKPQVEGIAFDATCSLVVAGTRHPLAVGADLPDTPDDAPHGITNSTNQTYDIILWCDHRAVHEAQTINDSGHQLLQFVGGQVSPEMEMPKLAWLKKFKPKTYAGAARFYDLHDYLLHRAADFKSTRGSAAGIRSLCTVVCKWNFNAAARSWDAGFFESAQLADLPYEKIGSPADVQDVGSAVPEGLGPKAAQDLGLPEGTVLGVGAIDAHAGGIGCLGVSAGTVPLEGRLALIAGTSACHMASSTVAVNIPGIWGPYESAMIPGLYLAEAGQTAAGAALDFIIESHAAYPELQAQADAASCSPSEVLNHLVRKLAESHGLQHAYLTRGIFVGPDFSGNRSPLADPNLRGSVIGLGPAGDPKQAASLDALAVLYLATIQALAYSSRSIIETMNSARAEAGVVSISSIHICGGLAQNALYLQEHADILNLPLHCTKCPSADVIRGSAMVAATAAGEFASVPEAMSAMQQQGLTTKPQEDPQLQRFHNARYQIFLRMQRHLQEYQALEASALET